MRNISNFSRNVICAFVIVGILGVIGGFIVEDTEMRIFFALLICVGLICLCVEIRKNEESKIENEPICESKQDIIEEQKVITSVEELKSKSSNNEVHNNYVELNNNYKIPPLTLLNYFKTKNENTVECIRSNKECLERVLNDFQILGKVVDIHVGPAITQYEIVVPTGTKLSRVSNINKEIALALAVKDVRIEAPIPGKSTFGISIPNTEIELVRIRDVLSYSEARKEQNGLWVALGKNNIGECINIDLIKMPHLLIAGPTGSGKSVCINSIIISLLMHYRPDEIKLVLVDPKQVELSNYNGIPHLLAPVVTDPKKASLVLQKVVVEMDKRYKILAAKGVKNIADYNKKIEEENKKHLESLEPKMNYLVVIVDEMADLIIYAKEEIEDSIMRITQFASKVGIHFILSTNSISTISTSIRLQFPSKIMFDTISNYDSIYLDIPRTEKLLGKGDMLYLPMGEPFPTRIQGCYISDDEINKIIKFVSKQQEASYDESLLIGNTDSSGASSSMGGGNDDTDDPIYDEVVKFAIETGKVSASIIQRRFRLGYNRAARIVDLLEERGIIGPQNGSKPREVLVKLKEEGEEGE